MSSAELSRSLMNFPERGDSGLCLALSIPAALPAAGFANRSCTAAGESKHPLHRIALAPLQTQALLAFYTFPTSSPTCQGSARPNTILQPCRVGALPQYPQTKPTWLQLQKGRSPYAHGEPDIHIFLLYIHSISWRHGADLYQRSSCSAPEFSGRLHMSLPQRSPAHASPSRSLFTEKTERDV